MADVIQQLKVEVNESISGRMDMLNSINTALQNVSAKPTDSKPYRISDFLTRNWEGSNEKGEFRSFTLDLHLWMQAWSNQGQQNQLIPSHIESVTSFQETGKAATKKEISEASALDLHLWMQAWSNQGEKMLLSVESTDKNSDQSRHRCTKYCTERQQTNR